MRRLNATVATLRLHALIAQCAKRLLHKNTLCKGVCQAATGGFSCTKRGRNQKLVAQTAKKLHFGPTNFKQINSFLTFSLMFSFLVLKNWAQKGKKLNFGPTKKMENAGKAVLILVFSTHKVTKRRPKLLKKCTLGHHFRKNSFFLFFCPPPFCIFQPSRNRVILKSRRHSVYLSALSFSPFTIRSSHELRKSTGG